jgi:glycosyltransferase involved in cell wall biosynthesis
MNVPIIHVLLATYNGAQYVRYQWASLEKQEGVEIVVHIADDGSSDGTVAILEEKASQLCGAVRAVHWFDAPPRRSASPSFLMLTAHAVSHCPEAKWFAYCDQDDIWLPGKLAAGHSMLASFAESTRPALYGGRTLAVDDNGHEHGLSPLFSQRPSFRNALTQNIMGGNTMLMNRAAAELVAGAAYTHVVAHDWLVYLLVSGADGFIQYDPRAFVRYRQHESNVVGSSLGWRARWHRLGRLLRGDHRRWNEVNAAILRQHKEGLAAVNLGVLEAFERARAARTPWDRIAWLRRSGVYRQNLREQLMLWLACALGRL